MLARRSRRTDIYAVGILLYTLVVGHGPFPHARDQQQLISAHVLVQPTSPSSAASQPIPAQLDRAILTALAKAPDQRFQTAEQFSAELGRIAASLDGPSPPLPVAAASAQPIAAPNDDYAPTILDRRTAVARSSATRARPLWVSPSPARHSSARCSRSSCGTSGGTEP